MSSGIAARNVGSESLTRPTTSRVEASARLVAAIYTARLPSTSA